MKSEECVKTATILPAGRLPKGWEAKESNFFSIVKRRGENAKKLLGFIGFKEEAEPVWSFFLVSAYFLYKYKYSLEHLHSISSAMS